MPAVTWVCMNQQYPCLITSCTGFILVMDNPKCFAIISGAAEWSDRMSNETQGQAKKGLLPAQQTKGDSRYCGQIEYRHSYSRTARTVRSGTLRRHIRQPIKQIGSRWAAYQCHRWWGDVRNGATLIYLFLLQYLFLVPCVLGTYSVYFLRDSIPLKMLAIILQTEKWLVF